MNLQHEAILSLNTRVRRLRYLFKAIDLVSENTISRQLLVKEFVDYGLSRKLYDEITQISAEPFSGHLFENISQSYEKNLEQRDKRRNSNVERVAESYIDLGLKLGLLVESDQRISVSQLAMPLRFLANSEWVPNSLQTEARNRYVLALLWRFDRDLTCPLLAELFRSACGVKIGEIESNWNTWEKNWINRIIEIASKQGLGNPVSLFRYLHISMKARKNPIRYAEHTALIRFHWFIDLGIAIGQPARSPTNFVPVMEPFSPLGQLLYEFTPYVATGDIAQMHFQICKVTTLRSSIDKQIQFSGFIVDFLKAARLRGSSNVRLNLLDIVWTSIVSLTGQLPSNFDEFCKQIDFFLKSEGVTIVKAPRREETYIPTRQ